MKKLDELGVKVDFSAVPGLRTTSNSYKKFPYNIYDWYITPRLQYHPAETDYRRAPREGENGLSILEVPNFTSNSIFWGIIAGLQMARKMKTPAQLIQSLGKPTYWVNLTGIQRLYSPLIKGLRKRLESQSRSPVFFVTYFHADELIENKSSIYSRDNLRRNLSNIGEMCEELEVPFEFIRAKHIPDIVD